MHVEEMLLPEVPLLGTLVLWASVLAMVVTFLVCIPRRVTGPQVQAEREPLKKAA